MAPDKLDKIFKNKFENSSNIPKKLDWKKKDAWNKLIEKRKKYRLQKLIKYSSVAVFLGIVFLLYPKFEDSKNKHVRSNYEDEQQEYRKRLKLKQIEMKLSGKKVFTNYCMNCEGMLPAKSEFQRNIIIFTN